MWFEGKSKCLTDIIYLFFLKNKTSIDESKHIYDMIVNLQVVVQVLFCTLCSFNENLHELTTTTKKIYMNLASTFAYQINVI